MKKTISQTDGQSGLAADLKRQVLVALGITVVSAVVGLAVNQFHPAGIPLIAKQEYQVLVPCPDFTGDVGVLAADRNEIGLADSFVVDARLDYEFEEWHYEGAINLPYDYLDPTPEEDVERIARQIASQRFSRVIVYGDGDNPDTGEQLGKEIAARGIKNVFYIKGGFTALQARKGGEGQ